MAAVRLMTQHDVGEADDADAQRRAAAEFVAAGVKAVDEAIISVVNASAAAGRGVMMLK